MITSYIDGVDVDGIVVGDEVVAHGVVEIVHLIGTSVLDTKIQKHYLNRIQLNRIITAEIKKLLYVMIQKGFS